MEPFIFDRVNWLIFCCKSEDDSRYSLNKPFVVDGFLYATDGRVLVRRQIDLPNTTGRKLPASLIDTIGEMKHDAIDADLWTPWPCEIPKQIKTSRYDCECRFSSRLDVPVESCDKCEGTGKLIEIDWGEGVDVNGHLVMLCNWRRVATLPDVESGPAVGVDGKIPIRFHGGIGIVMPMIREG